jgi:hypothetical protein
VEVGGAEDPPLEQREQSLVDSAADYQNLYEDPTRDFWSLYGSKALCAFSTKEIAGATRRGPGPVLAPGVEEARDSAGQPLSMVSPVPERTIRDARKRRPSPATEALVTAALVRLAAEALDLEGIAVPRTAPGSPYVDELACLSLFLEDQRRARRECALAGCSVPARARSPYCCQAHKKKAQRVA